MTHRILARLIALTVLCAADSPNLLSVGEASEPTVSFVHEVIPILTRHGCATGACHGSPSGKGGFRLSLRGFDPALDELTLIREQFGRRVNVADPATSLLLRKATMQTAHGGGRRLSAEMPGYQTLESWIRQGLPLDVTAAPALDRLSVTVGVQSPDGSDPDRGPRNALAPAASRRAQGVTVLVWPQQLARLSVQAHFRDGTTRDVTRLADYLSTAEDRAEINLQGVLRFTDRGETTIVVRYLHEVETVRLMMLRDVEGFVWPSPEPVNRIDELAFARLRELQIPTSAAATDAELVRRLYLDVAGRLPSVSEAEQFLIEMAETAPRDSGGRQQLYAALVEELLESNDAAEFQALQWAELLRVKRSRLGEAGVYKFHEWLVRSIRDDVPFDRLTRQLLTATGSTFQNPAAAYYRSTTGPEALAESTAQLFLGIRIQCARCHNHPFERWTQDHYYGLGAFFSRVQIEPTAVAEDLKVSYGTEGDLLHPRTGAPAPLRVPARRPVAFQGDGDRRAELANWLTAPDNPLFARVAVNRLWSRVFGRGLVEPADDFRDSNPASHPDVLEYLADEFVSANYSMRHVMRLMLTSRLYQLSSRTVPLNASDDRYFSHAYARLLRAEQLLDAVHLVTGAPLAFRGVPAGTRAVQLPSPEVGSDFLTTFGQPARNTVCECERDVEPKLTQALGMISGEMVIDMIRSPSGRLSSQLNHLDKRLEIAGSPPQEGLLVWLRADGNARDNDGQPATDGSRVARWVSGSAGGYVVEQPQLELQPEYVAEGIGGLPALRFGGVQTVLRNVGAAVLPAGRGRTVLVVAQAGERGGSLVTFGRSTHGQSGRTPIFTAQHVFHNGSYYVYSDGVNSSGNTTLPPESFSAVKQPFVTTFISSGAGSRLQLLVNGKLTELSQSGAVGLDSGQPGLSIGNREDYPGFGWDGLISEVLIYDSVLSPEQLSSAASYLSTKYALATGWPSRSVPTESAEQVAESNRSIIRELYLSAFSRFPTVEETQALLSHVEQAPDRRAGLEDVFWAVLNSKEFLFQH